METLPDRILNRILEEANKKARTIIKEAQRSADTILEDRKESARQSAEKNVVSLLKRAETEADIIRGRVATDIKRKAGWIVLYEKNRLVTSVLEEVKNRLVNLQKSKEYLPVLEKLIVNAATVLGGGSLKVILNENDSSLPLKLATLEKRIANETGAKTQLTISKQQTKAVGVIVQTNDGRIFVDNTFEAILSRSERDLRMKAARILFKS